MESPAARNIHDGTQFRWALAAFILVCGLLPLAGGKWSGGIFFVLCLFGFVPLLFIYTQLQSSRPARRVIAAVVTLALIFGTAWELRSNTDTPEHRKEWWLNDPEAGLHRFWVCREVNDQQKIMSAEFFNFKKDEVDITHTRSEATLAGVKESTDGPHTLIFRVKAKGIGKDGLPYVNFTTETPDVDWTAVLNPEKKTMDLFRAVSFVGRFSTVEL